MSSGAVWLMRHGETEWSRAGATLPHRSAADTEGEQRAANLKRSSKAGPLRWC